MAVAGWSAYHRHQAVALESEILALQQKIRLVRQQPEVSADDAGVSRQSREKTIRWEQTAAAIRRSGPQSFESDLRSELLLKGMLMQLTPQQLIDQITAVRALQCDQTTREKLLGFILEALAPKSPSLALEKFADFLNDSRKRFIFQLSGAFGKWHRHDAAAAIAWLDQKVQNGVFHPTGPGSDLTTRAKVEKQIFLPLLDSSPDQAAGRFASMPARDQAELLQQARPSKDHLLALHARLDPASADATLGNALGVWISTYVDVQTHATEVIRKIGETGNHDSLIAATVRTAASKPAANASLLHSLTELVRDADLQAELDSLLPPQEKQTTEETSPP